jgi:hypothetical protein
MSQEAGILKPAGLAGQTGPSSNAPQRKNNPAHHDRQLQLGVPP